MKIMFKANRCLALILYYWVYSTLGYGKSASSEITSSRVDFFGISDLRDSSENQTFILDQTRQFSNIENDSAFNGNTINEKFQDFLKTPKSENLRKTLRISSHSACTVQSRRKLYEFITDDIQVTSNASYGEILNLSGNKILVAWISQDLSTKGIFGQFFSHDGKKQGESFQLNSVQNPETNSKITGASLKNGSYVIVWHSEDFEIYCRLFDDSVSRGPEFVVNTHTTGIQQRPDIINMEDGGFLVIWESYGQTDRADVFAQRFNSDGQKEGSEFLVNTYSVGDQVNPSGTRLIDGEFLISWDHIDATDNNSTIHAQIFNSSDVLSTNGFTISSPSGESLTESLSSSLRNGNFVVVWRSFNDSKGIHGQLFEASGASIGAQFGVNDDSRSDQLLGGVIGMYYGGFTVVYSRKTKNATYDVFVQRYDDSATPYEGEVQINAETSESRSSSRITSLKCGFAVYWDSFSNNQWTSYLKIYEDTESDLRLKYPLSDMTIYKSQFFTFIIPASTFKSSPGASINCSVSIKVGDQYRNMNELWISFDHVSRNFSGTPTEVEEYLIQVQGHDGCSSVLEEFKLMVIDNSKPVLVSPIPPQLIPFNRDKMWEYSIPKHTFRDLEGDEIIYIQAVLIANQQEELLNATWSTLSFDSGRLHGIPNVVGNFTIRIHAADQSHLDDPATVDLNIQVVSQGIEILELLRSKQNAHKGFISSNDAFLWISNGHRLTKYEIIENNPHYIQDSSLEYELPGTITSALELSEEKIIIGDDLGNLKLVSSVEFSELSSIFIDESISDVCADNSGYIYVGHSSIISSFSIIEDLIQKSFELTVPSPITCISSYFGKILTGTQNGLYSVDPLTEDYSKIDLPLTELYEIAAHRSYLYILGKDRLLILNTDEQGNMNILSSWSLENQGTQINIKEIDGNVLCFISEGEHGLYILNVSDPTAPYFEGNNESIGNTNHFEISSSGRWGILFQGTEIVTVEVFRLQIYFDHCKMDDCSNAIIVQAENKFHEDRMLIEVLPIFKEEYSYSFYSDFSGSWLTSSGSTALPSWIIIEKIGETHLKLHGEAPKYLAGTVVHIEITAHLFKSIAGTKITLRKLVSLSIVPRHASLNYYIPDQSLEVGEEWSYAFPDNIFANADTFESRYKINSEWMPSEDLSWIRFNPPMRHWHISVTDSNKQTLFQCESCESVYSEVYVIEVTGRNSASDSDPGISTSFILNLYSGRIPDQEIHPGISKTIILDESIFPNKLEYTVSLVGGDGQLENLPWWMTYISNERKILMFPSYLEIDSDFHIRVSGYNEGVLLESDFTIKIRNKPPMAEKDLVNQRVKLGSFMDYQISEDTFTDPDNDPIKFSIQWVKKDGTKTSALPVWVNFDSSTRTLYGSPSEEGDFKFEIVASDDLGGMTSKQMNVTAYNNHPFKNPEVIISDQSVHIGEEFSLFLPDNLFLDSDSDVLTFQAEDSESSGLPSWLAFNSLSLNLLGTPVSVALLNSTSEIIITASDGYSKAMTSFIISVLNNPPMLVIPIESQLSDFIFQGLVVLKPGVKLEFEFSLQTFVDGDDDILQYLARQSNENPLPNWLNFDSYTRKFYGTPSGVNNLAISVTATDGYASETDTFVLNITNKVPYVSNALQSQFDAVYPEPLIDGTLVSFQFSTDTFIDEDDVLTYSVLFTRGEEDWRDIKFCWLENEGRTLSGTVQSDSVESYTIHIQVIASDQLDSVSDKFSMQILSMFPALENDRAQIVSEKNSITVEVISQSTKIAMSDFGSAFAEDISNNSKTNWVLEGFPGDVNCILDKATYRISNSRNLLEDMVTLRIHNLEKEYPISIFTYREPISSLRIPNQNGYIENNMNLNIKHFFNYSDTEQLKYTFEILHKPSDANNWLTFDSGIVSGTPTHENTIGTYKIQIKAIDEFEEFKTTTFEIYVDYTYFQKFMNAFFLFLEFGGPILTILGVIAYRPSIYNCFARANKRSVPIQIHESSVQVRKYFWLKTDEESIAKMIVDQLPKDYNTTEDSDLCLRFDHIYRMLLVKNVTANTSSRVTSVNIENSPTSRHKNYPFSYSLENDQDLLIEVNGSLYHTRYIYYFAKDLLFRNLFNKQQLREIKALVVEFKREMRADYIKKCPEMYFDSKYTNLSSCKNVWAMNLPDLTKPGVPNPIEVITFLDVRDEVKHYEVFFNRLRVEYWNDMAVRIQHSSDIKAELFYRAPVCCKIKRNMQYNVWFCNNWLSTSITDSEIVITVDSTKTALSEDLNLRFYDKDGYLLIDLMIVNFIKEFDTLTNDIEKREYEVDKFL